MRGIPNRALTSLSRSQLFQSGERSFPVMLSRAKHLAFARFQDEILRPCLRMTPLKKIVFPFLKTLLCRERHLVSCIQLRVIRGHDSQFQRMFARLHTV